VSIGEEWRVTVTAGAEVAARFAGVSWQSLTSFVVFEVTVRSGDEEARAAFVLNLPLEGGPEDRHDRLLEAVLKDRSAVLRFLMLLLADEGLELAAVQAMYDAGGGVLRAELDPSFDVPLLEVMVRALYRDPAKLDRVARLVRDLRRTDAGRNLLPEGFEEVWEPIWQARVKELDGERP
jgi:hypothetical protein